MRIFTILIASLTMSALAALAGGKGWLTDLEKAFAEAKANDKPVLVEFTGSDWCPPCIMMRKQVFTKASFIEEASKKFVLVEIDIPNGDPELRQKNIPVLEKYGVQGVPTVVLFDAEGKEFDRFGASAFPTPRDFLARLDKALSQQGAL